MYILFSCTKQYKKEVLRISDIICFILKIISLILIFQQLTFFNFSLQVFFLLFVVYLTLVLLQRLRREKLMFFTLFWNWLDSTACMLAWSSLALYIACVVMATKRMNLYFDDSSLPARVGQVAVLHAILRYVHGCILFLFLLKVNILQKTFKIKYYYIFN